MARMGEIIDGKYEVLREVGRGGMSVVYLAMDKRLNKQWAIKEFRKDKDDASKQVALDALLKEANLMKKLDHPTLPRIVDIIENKETVYVIMDYIEGESLNKVLDAYGAQPQEAVIEWAKQLSEVLDYLHTQSPPVIYRDMKPANIMLKPDGTVRLIDFGIAREFKEGKSGDTEAIGTRGYAAPEQFGGKGQTDARTDIYSLGVTLYHLVTGKNPAEPPYEIYPIRHWDPSFSSGFEWLIQKCTQLNPGDRYQSCAEVTYVLENLEKFDTEYKKKKRIRFNLFLSAVITTLAFSIISASCFLGGVVLKGNTYDQNIKDKRYVDAINVDAQKSDAYVYLSQQLNEIKPVIKPGEYRGKDADTTISANVTTGDLDNWFSNAHMNDLLQSDPKAYARVQFELGYLMWERYESEKSENQDAEVIQKSMGHFEKVISVAQSGKVDEYAGLSKDEYEFARVLYLITYFQNNRGQFEPEGDLGRTNELTLSEVQIFAGINEEAYKTSPYNAFWNVLMDTTQYLDESSFGTTALRVKVLDRVTYIFSSTYDKFFSSDYGKVDVKEAETFVATYKKIHNSIDGHAEEKNQMKQEFNNAVSFINSDKKINVDNKVALEVIQ